MEWFKGRKVNIGGKVHVYRNIHRDSIVVRCAKTGLVAGYCDTVKLSNVRFVVSESGRQRVLEKQVRSVHAWLSGTLEAYDIALLEKDRLTAVYYQPYKTPTFIIEKTGEPIHVADLAFVSYNRAYLSTEAIGLDQTLLTMQFE